LQVAVLTVVDKVNSGVEIRVPHPLVAGHRRAPVSWIAANEVVSRGVLLDFAGYRGRVVGARKTGPQRLLPAPRNDSFAWREIQDVGTTACEIADIGRCLPSVRLKSQRQAAPFR